MSADDFGLLEDYRLQADAPRIGPRHRRQGRPNTGLRAATVTTTTNVLHGARDGLREGLRAALARDVPTSTPTGAGEFRRIWRAQP